MEKVEEEAEQQWEKEGGDVQEVLEDEEADLLAAVRRPRIQTPPSSTTSSVSSGHSCDDDNGGDVVNGGHADQGAEQELELEKIKANGVKIDALHVINTDFLTNRTHDLSHHVDEDDEDDVEIDDKMNVGAEVDAVEPKGSDYCVYFDKDQGIWKCRFCSWSIQSGSCLVDHVQSFKRQWHTMMNSKILNEQVSCFIHETEGAGFGYEFPVEDLTRVECYAQKIHGDENLDVAIQNFETGNGLNNQHVEHAKHEIVSASSLQLSEISFEELNKTSFCNKAIEDADIDLINDGDEETELDVETVLKKQETHDLFCPNCNSCITRRVILRKRKRRVRTAEEDAKRNRLESLIHSDLDPISAGATNNQAQVEVNLNDNLPPGSNDCDREREPDVFRCLSCLSIFIPTRDGIKLFQMFGDSSKRESTQDSQKTPVVKYNWFSSIFASKKGVMLTEAGIDQKSDVGKSNVGALSNLDEPKGETSSRQEVVPHGSYGMDVQDKNVGTIDPYSKLEDSKGEGSSVLDVLLPSSTFVMGLGGSRVSVPSLTQVPVETRNAMIDMEQKLDNATGKGKGVIALGHFEAVTLHTLNSTGFPNGTLHNKSGLPEATSISKLPLTNGEPVENVIPLPQQNGLKFSIPSNVGTLVVEEAVQTVNVTVQKESSDENTILLLSTSSFANEESNMHGTLNNSAPVPSRYEQNVAAALSTESGLIEIENEKVTDEDGAYKVSQEHIGHNKVEIHQAESLIYDKDSVISSAQDVLLLQDGRINISKDSKHVFAEIDAGKDAIITIAADQVETVPSQSPQTQREIGTTAGEDRSLDIVKSIVYGGLIESITSVGVVSSAAGADAATINVIVLGLANLFGGLFVIGNDLWDLKNEHTGGDSNRYEIILGRRANFLLHSVVAVFSYLIFGLLPPIIYGFSFRKSDDRDLKLLVVAAASLLCIVVLAAGKAYVQRPPKSYLKTIIYYVIMGLVVSGAAYVVGNMLNRFLRKLEIFPSSSVVTLALPGTGLMEPSWGSY